MVRMGIVIVMIGMQSDDEDRADNAYFGEYYDHGSG